MSFSPDLVIMIFEPLQAHLIEGRFLYILDPYYFLFTGRIAQDCQAEVTVRKAMEEMVQLNQGQPYTYDREALIGMLDELLEATAAPAGSD